MVLSIGVNIVICTSLAGIFSALKEGSNLHIANSSPVRYAQLFDDSYRVKMHCNRGTSGIEGCTSTAMGSAAASVDKSFYSYHRRCRLSLRRKWVVE